MRSTRALWLPALFVVAVFTLVSCGGSGEGEMQGMDDGGSGGQSMEETTSAGMESGSTNMDAEASRKAVAPNGEYSDVAFVDAMIPHHEGALEMAEVAPDNAEHEEIRTLAQEIVEAQEAEIEELGKIRDGLGGSTMKMSGDEMEGMRMSEDPRELAESRPFDKAFIDAMTPHHESAVEMANVALEESQNPEILSIAEDIVAGQERELSQMRQWREEWYPEG